MNAESLFGRDRAIIGMVHVRALPGTPRCDLPVDRIVERATGEAKTLAQAGFDAVIVENMHDVPYLRREVGPEIVATMSAVVGSIVAAIDRPVGVQVLAGANRAAVAVAHATGARFIRAEGFAYAAVADEGLLDEADAGPLLRYRAAIGADAVAILADVKKKHTAHAITADVDLAEFARTSAFMGADGVIVTGSATGRVTQVTDVRRVRESVDVPVLVGSGVTPDRVEPLFEHAHALIVGSWCKEDGHWANPLDRARVDELVAAAVAARERQAESV